MNRRSKIYAGHGEGSRSEAGFDILVGCCRMNGVEPYCYLLDLFTQLAHGHLKKALAR